MFSFVFPRIGMAMPAELKQCATSFDSPGFPFVFYANRVLIRLMGSRSRDAQAFHSRIRLGDLRYAGRV